MLYCSWDMLHDRCNYFSFWAIFCPFTPITDWKIKIIYIKKKEKKKKRKKHLWILSFYISVPKIMIILIICYTVPEIWCVMDAIIFHFGPFFALLAPEKYAWRHHHFTHVHQKLWLDDVHFLRNGVRWADGRKKWHI